MFYQTHFNQFFHLSPGFQIVFMNIRNSVGVTRIHVYALRMVIGEGPMDDAKIEIIQLQIGKSLFAGWDDIFFGVSIVPQF